MGAVVAGGGWVAVVKLGDQARGDRIANGLTASYGWGSGGEVASTVPGWVAVGVGVVLLVVGLALAVLVWVTEPGTDDAAPM